MVAIATRARLCVLPNLRGAAPFLPTHVFLTAQQLDAMCEEIERRIRSRFFLWRAQFRVRYPWEKFTLSWGRSSGHFGGLREDLGIDCRFLFAAGALDSEVHELLTVVYGRPIATVFVPAEWGTLGFALPCDVKFTKYGTMGGPIVPLVRISEEGHPIGVLADGREVELDVEAFWDEEGSFVIKG
jgi:hypothetical protein